MGFINGETILAKVQGFASAQCIPTNNILLGPLTKVITDVEGAIGGLLFGVVILMVVLLALLCVVTILSKRAETYMKAMAVVFLVPLVTILAIIIYTAIVTGFNSSC